MDSLCSAVDMLLWEEWGQVFFRGETIPRVIQVPQLKMNNQIFLHFVYLNVKFKAGYFTQTHFIVAQHAYITHTNEEGSGNVQWKEWENGSSEGN